LMKASFSSVNSLNWPRPIRIFGDMERLLSQSKGDAAAAARGHRPEFDGRLN
jgi:hypothetical protein